MRKTFVTQHFANSPTAILTYGTAATASRDNNLSYLMISW